MKMRTIEISVGLLMLAGLLALMVLALQVSGLNNFFETQLGYKVKAVFNNIGGLKAKAKVSIGGVVVGRVTGISLDAKSFNATVDMVIDPKKIAFLPQDSHASILTAGLLGDNYVGITPGFDDHDGLKEGSVINVENTNSALVLEELISKFVSNTATNSQQATGNKETK